MISQVNKKEREIENIIEQNKLFKLLLNHQEPKEIHFNEKENSLTHMQTYINVTY